MELGSVTCLRTIIFAATIVSPVCADFVVAPDGTGDYRRVQDAIDAAPQHLASPFTIRIKPGVYRERIVVPHSKPFLRLVGEHAKSTVLTFGLYASMAGEDGKPIGTFKTSSTTIDADDFSAEGLTFENSAGPVGQAVALTVLGDRAIFRHCRFLGWQDTLLAQTGRQLFDDDYIEGAVDFIFGGSTAWFENSEIHVAGNGYITAASTPKDQPWGYIFAHCRITGERGVKTDLGRPWRDNAAVVYLHTEMSDVVRPAGWNNWQKPERELTARYAEFASSGPGANDGARVPWAHRLSDSEAARITKSAVLSGTDGWNPVKGTRAAVHWSIPAAATVRMKMPGAANGQIVWATRDDKLAHGDNRLDIMAGHAGGEAALDVRNAALFYDEAHKRYIISWASTISSNFFQSYQEPVDDSPRLWYTTTTDFQSFDPPRVLFDPGYTVRYGIILRDRGRYALLHEDSRCAIRQLRVSFSDTPAGPWGPSSDTLGEGFRKRVKIALAGDSTVAEQGGWGPGFRESLGPDVEVLNFARNGRSSKSFRDEGLWNDVLGAHADYVLIQFGHNDVPGKGPDRETAAAGSYRDNLIRFADEVRAQGGIPVLVTSIVRRNLEPDGHVKPDSLIPYVQAVRATTARKHILIMDLYARTLAQCEFLGAAGCHELDAVTIDGAPDTTHLGDKGRREVGRIAAQEFLRTILPGQLPR
jgi:pectinesterase